MQVFNAIGQPRWNSPLVRFFGMKIGGAAAPSLAPEIAPSFDVNQQDDAQLAFLRGEKRASYGAQINAAPGFYTTAALRNPTGSGVLVIVRRIVGYSTGGWVNVSLSQISDLTNAGSCTAMDTRWGANNLTSARYTFRNDSAGPLSGARIAQLRNGIETYQDMPVVLSPGFALILETSVVNLDLTFAFEFIERTIPAEELATG